MALTQEHFDETIKDLKGLITTRFDKLEKDISVVHSDLIKHDERAETYAANILAMYELQKKVEKIRQFIHETHGVEL